MWAAEVALCFWATYAANSSDHEHSNAALNDGANERCEALRDEKKTGRDMHVVSQFHIGDESSSVLIVFHSGFSSEYAL